MGVLKNDVGRPSNKTIKIRFILKLIGLILLMAACFIIGYKLSGGSAEVNQTTEQNKSENKEEIKKEEKPDSKKTINIYGKVHESIEYSYKYLKIRDKSIDETDSMHDSYDEGFDLIGTYACKNEDCVLKEQTTEDLETMIIKDGDFIVYNYKTKESNKIKLENESMDFIVNPKYDYLGYSGINLEAQVINNKTYYVINVIVEERTTLGIIGPDYKPIFLIDNEIIDNEDPWKDFYYDVTFLENEDIIYFQKDKYYRYDSKSKKTIESKQYKSVELIDNKGYIVVVDIDDYLKVLDFSGKVKAKLVKITDDMFVHSLLSGWYEENKKEGIYVIVEDKNVKFEELSEKLRNELGSPENANLGYEYYYIPSTGEYGKIPTYIGGYAKPVLYLYPKKDNTKVTVDFAKEDLLVTTYPKFKNNWEVTANKNGDLYDSNGKYYYGLYWDEKGSIKVDFDEGFYVTKDNAIEFLEEKLSIIGLNDRERNEFIMYWLPILERNEKNLVYFELTSSREAYNKLIINPKPDSLLRIAIHIKKVDKEVSIKEQELKTFERKGFTAVEWGGVVH